MSTPPSQLPIKWDQQLVDHYRLYREYLEHEDDLINHRSTWHNTIQGLLFTALGVTVQWKPDPSTPRAHPTQSVLFVLLPVLGTAIGVAAVLSIDAATRALNKLGDEWQGHMKAFYAHAHPPLPALAGAGDRRAILYGKAPATLIPICITIAWLILLGVNLHAQTQPLPITAAAVKPSGPPSEVAGIPVNYDETKVGTYTLPDALTLLNGTPVRDAKTWQTKRRPEIVALFESQQYGKAPARPAAETFTVTDRGAPALNGKALRKQITISFSEDPTWPVIHLVEYLPAAAKKPVPMLLNINFGAPSSATGDSGLPAGLVWDGKTKQKIPTANARNFGHLEIEPFLDAGIGVATFYYGDIDPDFPEGRPLGIRARYPNLTQADAWGSIAAWAWGMSRVEDYFETDKQVDPKRVAIHGISRLGKTVMWAGAHDQRFAAVIASCSGEGGAALSYRNYGETIAHLTAPTRYPYQFAANYAQYAGFPDKAPMDANLLIALIAPRPLLLQTGDSDAWSDPKGEFLAAVAAAPVYQLLGKQPLGTTDWPPAGTPIFHDLGYYMHHGGHGMVPTDWDIYVQFLKMHLHPES